MSNQKIISENNKDHQSSIAEMKRKHWRHLLIYVGINAVVISLSAWYFWFLGSETMEGAGLAGIPLALLVPVVAYAFFFICGAGVVYTLGMYIQIKQLGYKKTYWPAVLMLLISAWPFILMFFHDGPLL